jgi:hypothetical protein
LVVAFLIAAFFALRARQEDDAVSQQRRDEPFTVLRPLDSFDRPDDALGLGAVPGGPQWEAAADTWGIAANQAYVVTPAAGRNIAVVELGQEEGAVQVRIPKMTAGAGIVFRYRDPSNYWAVFARPPSPPGTSQGGGRQVPSHRQHRAVIAAGRGDPGS